MTTTIPKAFFAYPSSGHTLRESIRSAVAQLNNRGLIGITTWEECNIGGKLLIGTICNAIDESELFFADLTGLNANVMFELGYAIARNKRIWLIFDTAYATEKNLFNQLKVLTTVGYRECHNSQEIVSAFYQDNPIEDIENTLFRTAIEPSLTPGGYDGILHLKGRYEDEAAMRVSNFLQKNLPKEVIIDDPRESSIQSLTWYGSRVFGCGGVVCHFMHPEREGAYLQTARHALVCGIASGFEKPLLMLAEGDFLAPVDYREYLKNYEKAPEALEYLQEWLNPVEQDLKTKQKATKIQNSAKLATNLKNLRFGEHVAENEEQRLVAEYFIETAAYDDAVKGNQTVFVGRKGSGKTANLMKLESQLSSSRQNLVCVIKPQDYEMQGIVDLLMQYKNRHAKGAAIESLWKFLLLTEIANIAIDTPSHTRIDDAEKNFLKFVDQHRAIIREDFTTRLENCIQSLSGVVEEANIENSHTPISEALHSGFLKQLRAQLGPFLSKKQRIAILVDNLDKAWEQRNDIEGLSQILLGLLEVARKLPVDLQRQDSRRHRIPVSLAVFLRSDIFYRIRRVAPEPDKLPYSLLKWDNPELLRRIIEERFSASFEPSLDSDILWKQYFCSTVSGISTKNYITEAILRRPRDIIVLVNEAVAEAINRGHTRIEEEDVLEAEKQYSQYAFDSVKVENTLPEINLENAIFEFVGVPSVLRKSEVMDVLKCAEVPEDMLEPAIDVFHDLTFLGLEIDRNTFVFSDAPEESRKNKVLARRFARKNGHQERFQIHKAFRAFLETEEI